MLSGPWPGVAAVKTIIEDNLIKLSTNVLAADSGKCSATSIHKHKSNSALIFKGFEKGIKM